MHLTRLLVCLLLAAAARAQLPPPWAPPENPTTPAKVVLGKILFWDEQLADDDSTACGTCHLPELGGGDGRLDQGLHPGPDGSFGTADDVHGSPGIVHQDQAGDFTPAPLFGLRRQATRRTAATPLGAAHFSELFWDGRADGTFVDPETSAVVILVGGALESQAIGPILNSVEMGREGRTWADVRQKLQSVVPLRLATALPHDVRAAIGQNPTYPRLFRAAFGDLSITAARIAMALASYQRTLQPDDTPWDRYVGGDPSALTNAEKSGWLAFQNQGQCIACHWTPLFADDMYHNLGLRWSAEDVGRAAVSQVPVHVGAFRTPTLRNAGLRPRLFHNGQSPALGDPAQVTDPASTLNVYFQGHGVDTSNLDPFLQPLGQLGVPLSDLVLIQDFVRTALTDQRAALALPPFDHPTLRSVAQPPPRVFGPALAGAREPFFVDTVPSFAGNAHYKLGLAAGDGAGLAVVAWGLASIEPAATVAGLPWHLHVVDWLPFPLAGQPGEPGHATWHLPLPSHAALARVPLYFQLLAADPLAPGGIAASSGFELFVR